MATTDRTQARRQLDRRLKKFKPLINEPRPHQGWIRAIRSALGMTSRDLADRMGIIQQAIRELERSELFETIKLDTLQRAANALECDLVYAFVPRTSLDAMVKEQAYKKATELLSGVAHHSRLEDQEVMGDDAAEQVKEIMTQMIDRRGLWRLAPTSNEL
ncbi:MAG: mobile mystery protein A [Acidimicrobiales bacterium]